MTAHVPKIMIVGSCPIALLLAVEAFGLTRRAGSGSVRIEIAVVGFLLALIVIQSRAAVLERSWKLVALICCVVIVASCLALVWPVAA